MTGKLHRIRLLLSRLRCFKTWRLGMRAAFQAVGILLVTYQCLGVVGLPRLLPETAWTWIFVLIPALALVHAVWPRSVEVCSQAPKFRIKLVVGDIFDEKTAIGINVADTFDTEVGRIVANNSLIGQFIQKFTVEEANVFERDLHDQLQKMTTTGEISKEGRTLKYGVGSTVTTVANSRPVHLVALAEMDATNEAGCDIDIFISGLMQFWKYIRGQIQGEPLSVPLFGTGLTRLSNVLPADTAIKLIAFTFMLASREKPVTDDLRIVVLPEIAERLDMQGMQSFLNSLALQVSK